MDGYRFADCRQRERAPTASEETRMTRAFSVYASCSRSRSRIPRFPPVASFAPPETCEHRDQRQHQHRHQHTATPCSPATCRAAFASLNTASVGGPAGATCWVGHDA